MIEEAVKLYPNFQVVATTLRAVKSASCNDWGAIAWKDGRFAEASTAEPLKFSTGSAAATASLRA